MNRSKRTVPSVEVLLPTAVHGQATILAKSEHQTVDDYIAFLIEREFREREVVYLHTPADAPEPAGPVIREQDESYDDHAQRSSALKVLFRLP